MALLPQMLERGAGTIVNISSIAATLSAPGEAAYDASKAALTAFSEAMAVDLWETGVKVMVVYPGVIDTDLFSLPDNDIPDLPIAGRARVGRRRCHSRRAGLRGGPGLRARVLRRHRGIEGAGCGCVPAEHGGLPARAAARQGTTAPGRDTLDGCAPEAGTTVRPVEERGAREGRARCSGDERSPAGAHHRALRRRSTSAPGRSPAARSPSCAAGTWPISARSG